MIGIRGQPLLRLVITRFPVRTSSVLQISPLIPVFETRQTGLMTSSYSTTTSQQTADTTGETGQASSEARRRARLLTLATASATAMLGSLYILYKQTKVVTKADGGGVIVQVRYIICT